MRLTAIVSIAAALSLVPLAAHAQQDSYSRGYQQGYEAENPGAIPPIAPIAPIPPIGQTEYGQGIKDGADAGLEANGEDHDSGYDEGYQAGQDDSDSGDSDSDQ